MKDSPLLGFLSLSPSVSVGGRGLFAGCSSSIVLTCFCLGCVAFRVTAEPEHTRRFKVGGAVCSSMLLSRLLSLLHSHGLRPVCPSWPLTPDNNRAFSTARPPPTAWMFSLDCNVLYKPQSWWWCCGNPSRSAVPVRPRSDARSQPQLVVFSRCLVAAFSNVIKRRKEKKKMCELLNLGEIKSWGWHRVFIQNIFCDRHRSCIHASQTNPSEAKVYFWQRRLRCNIKEKLELKASVPLLATATALRFILKWNGFPLYWHWADFFIGLQIKL